MSESRRPRWADEELIACLDGPLNGQWFTAADWHERHAAAQYMATKSQPTTAIDAYQPTGHQVAHPHVYDVHGIAWTSTPTTGEPDAHEIDVPELVTTSDTWQLPDHDATEPAAEEWAL